MKELFLKTPDNLKIAINHYKAGHKNVIIMAHGWFMTKDSKAFADMAEVFSEENDVVALDFRGHGKSSGLYTFTAKESIDLKIVVDWAKEQYEKIYLMGFSLGAALVLIHGASEKNVDKIIAISAPCDFDKIENHVWRKEAWLPTLQKFELKRWFSVRPSIMVRKKIKPIEIVDKIEVPTIFVAGEFDPTVHCWHTKELFEKAVCPKRFELFKDCYHAEDLFLQERDKFVRLCKEFLL